jgi:putative PIN family toxin of toxin-antitoxin system
MQQTRKQVVLDANIVISAIIKPRGTASRALEKAMRGSSIIEPPRFGVELIEFASRLEIGKKRALDPNRISELLKTMARNEIIKFVDPAKKHYLCRDERDNDFIDLAIEYNAVLLSGDTDILSLKETLLSYDVRVLSPREFLEEA